MVTATATTIPPEVLPLIRDDLGADDAKDCLEQQHTTFEQMVRARRITLNTSGGPVLLVRGLGPCLGGANNGPFLMYARFSYGRFGEAWRKVFEDTGVDVKPLQRTTHHWRDVEFWRHSSAFRSIRVVYSFDGGLYKPVRCNMVQFSDYEGHKLPKPIYEQCE